MDWDKLEKRLIEAVGFAVADAYSFDETGPPEKLCQFLKDEIQTELKLWQHELGLVG